ncbi:MAG: 1-deoxy-D-xylulose-5-phosphate reductoisomerase [Formosimonas sp.]
MMPQVLTILGATGSIGRSTLNVVAQHPNRFSVFALTGGAQIELLAEQCVQFKPRYAVVLDEAAAQDLRGRLHDGVTQVLVGATALEWVASAPEVTTVMAAIVGAAGLRSAMAAAQAGKRILLANKESLVMAGGLMMAAVQKSGAVLLPIDSEHNALFQCLPHGSAGVASITLTASGGPFLHTPVAQLQGITPEQACAHPRWSMGRKISVDSATMMNKGLEVIEAHWLFGMAAEHINVVIHPQSVIHSLVNYVDGSSLAQLGHADMRVPIAHALAYPERIGSGVSVLDLATQGALEFYAPDLNKFVCLRLAFDALRAGGAAPIVLNAANECAVAAFLAHELAFVQIAQLNERALNALQFAAPNHIDEVMVIDAQTRAWVAAHLKGGH